MNVNERIVNCWLTKCRKMLTTSEIIYNNFNAAIDLLAIDLQNEKPLAWDIEVKLRTGGIHIALNNTPQNGYYHFRDQLNNTDRDQHLRNIIFPSIEIEKIFITNRKFLRNKDKNNEYWESKFKTEENITVLYFEDIITELQKKARQITTSNDEILQILRLHNTL
ncbi:MAG: hypothetical protein SOY65_06490 [Marinifilaceae bacterium]|nr:hypothetical protein [Marinifilaceae bacterium]